MSVDQEQPIRNDFQNISQAAVALGNTWEVNAVIVSGVLVMILVANFLAAIFPKLPLKVTYVALILSCLTLYFLDLSRFAFLPYVSERRTHSTNNLIFLYQWIIM
ncbi:hypothetical protein [Desulfobacca acetoxidans]